MWSQLWKELVDVVDLIEAADQAAVVVVASLGTSGATVERNGIRPESAKRRRRMSRSTL
jgi:hypothetical protein